jgi:hypothetical protein
MSDHYNRNGTNAPRNPELAKALDDVAKSLPEKFIVDDRAIERLVVDYKTARSEKRKGAQELNALFDKLYGVYVCLNACPKDLDRFLYKWRAGGITVDLDADLSQTLVEFYVRGRSKRAIKYAAALCEAATQKIKVGVLALRLGNVGPQDMRTMTSLLQPTSIKAMAEEFADRQKKQGKPAITLMEGLLPHDRGPCRAEPRKTALWKALKLIFCGRICLSLQ